MRLVSLATLFLLLVTVLGLEGASPPNLSKALSAQRELADSSPGDVGVLNDLGNLLVLAGELEEAEKVYLEALELDPDNAATHYNMALLLQQTGRPKHSEREFRRALELDPDNAWAHYQMGTLLAETGKRRAAIDHYAKAFYLDRRLAEPTVNSHFLENELATQALLVAYSLESSAAAAPRRYREPARITDLMVPAVELVEESSPETEAAATGGPRVSTWAPGAEGEGGAPVQDPGAAEEPTGGAGGAVTGPARETRPSRTPPSRGSTVLVVPPAQQRVVSPPPVQTGGPPAEQAPSAPSEQAPLTPAEEAPAEPIEETAPGLAEEPPDSAQPLDPGFEPDLPSTGRLDLRLLPADPDRLAAVTPGPVG